MSLGTISEQATGEKPPVTPEPLVEDQNKAALKREAPLMTVTTTTAKEAEKPIVTAIEAPQTSKSSCLYCKAESMLLLALGVSIIILILSGSYKVIKSA